MNIETIGKDFIKELNEVEINQGSMYCAVGNIIHKHLEKVDAKKQRKVISEIKKSEQLKLSPQFVYDCYRMIKKFPEMAQENWKPLEGLTPTHYFEISRYKLDTSIAHIVLSNVAGGSIRDMKSEVGNYREEKGVNTERESLLAKVRAKVSKLDIEQLRKADQFLFDLLETKK